MYNFNPARGAQHETLGANTGTTRGALITANASANTKGSYANVGGTTSFTYEAITVYIAKGSAQADFTVDIAINVGGNRFIICPDLRFCTRKAIDDDNTAYCSLPIHVPKGSQLSAQCQSSTGGATCDVIIVGSSDGVGGVPGFAYMILLCAIATSRGVAIDPGATANTKPAYIQMIASSSTRIAAILAFVGPNADTGRAAAASLMLDIAKGGAAAEEIIVTNLYISWSSSSDMPRDQVHGPFACDAPASTRFASTAQCTDNTAGDRTVDLTLWGFVR